MLGSGVVFPELCGLSVIMVGRDGEFFLLDFRWKPDRSRSIVTVEPPESKACWRESAMCEMLVGKRGAVQVAATEPCRRCSTRRKVLAESALVRRHRILVGG